MIRYVRRHGSRSILLGGLVLILTGAAGLVSRAGAQTAPPASPSSFSVVAQSDALAVELTDQNAPVFPPPGQILYATPASSQSKVDSLGGAAGYASAPYPGHGILDVIGAVNGVVAFCPPSPPCNSSPGPSSPSIPPYPFIVASNYPGTPTSTQSNGPYSISTQSGANGATSDARLGVTQGSPSIASTFSTSTANLDPNTGVLTAQADSAITGFSIGPLLSIGEITGHAKLVAQPGENPNKDTAFSVGSVTILGTPVGLTSKGFGPTQGTPVGLDLNGLTGVLSNYGISINYLPATQTATSVDSAGLAISFVHQVQTQGQVKETVILGRVQATTESGPVSSGATGGLGGAVGSDQGSSATAAGSEANSAQTNGATELGSAPSLAGSTGTESPSVAGNPTRIGTGRPGTSTLSPVSLARGHLASDMGSGLYLALVGTGLVLAAAAGLFEVLGLRLGLRGPRPAAIASAVRLHLPDDL